MGNGIINLWCELVRILFPHCSSVHSHDLDSFDMSNMVGVTHFSRKGNHKGAPTGNEPNVAAGLVPAQLPASGTGNIEIVPNCVSPI